MEPLAGVASQSRDAVHNSSDKHHYSTQKRKHKESRTILQRTRTKNYLRRQRMRTPKASVTRRAETSELPTAPKARATEGVMGWDVCRLLLIGSHMFPSSYDS